MLENLLIVLCWTASGPFALKDVLMRSFRFRFFLAATLLAAAAGPVQSRPSRSRWNPRRHRSRRTRRKSTRKNPPTDQVLPSGRRRAAVFAHSAGRRSRESRADPVDCRQRKSAYVPPTARLSSADMTPTTIGAAAAHAPHRRRLPLATADNSKRGPRTSRGRFTASSEHTAFRLAPAPFG